MKYTPNIISLILNKFGFYTEIQVDNLMRLQDEKRYTYTKRAYLEGVIDGRKK